MVTDQKEISEKMKDVCPIISKIIMVSVVWKLFYTGMMPLFSPMQLLQVAPADSPLAKICEVVKTKIGESLVQTGDNSKEQLDQKSDKKVTPTQQELEGRYISFFEFISCDDIEQLEILVTVGALSKVMFLCIDF